MGKVLKTRVPWYCPKCGAQTEIHERDLKQSGWAVWGLGKRIGWVILNVYLFCIPLLIYSFNRFCPDGWRAVEEVCTNCGYRRKLTVEMAGKSGGETAAQSQPKAAPRTQSQPAGKRFDMPLEFDHIYHLLMQFAATLYDPDEITVGISAYARDYEGHRAGDIRLTLSSVDSLDWRKESLYKSDSSSNKGLYNLFYGSAYHGESVIRYDFHEPDCYIFRCPEGPFRQEVEEYCKHAYVDFYRHYDNGYFCAIIKFRPISSDEVSDNLIEYERYNKVVFGI